MALGFHEVEYYIPFDPKTDGERPEPALVRGVQVGRFAVRYNPTNEEWIVDHIPTGCLVASFFRAEDAHLVADDISRFSAKDPASKNKERAVKQMGSKIGAWVRFLRTSDRVLGFREWRAEQGV